MLKFKTSCAVLAYLSSNLLNEVGLSLFRYFKVGLRVCNIVVNKFTFAISSPDEFLFFIHTGDRFLALSVDACGLSVDNETELSLAFDLSFPTVKAATSTIEVIWPYHYRKSDTTFPSNSTSHTLVPVPLQLRQAVIPTL